jgi:uncharacterized protein YndB with AHSA1/START domain/DNA-binding transcriptional ArsR family regulator
LTGDSRVTYLDAVPDETVIAAISDPSRRVMLDALRRRDGQTVSELGAALPHLGRHAVLKHLAVLERSALVLTRKVGRARHCYLNPVPLVALARRWLDDFAVAGGAALVNLRSYLESEGGDMTTTHHCGTTASPPRHVHQVVIAASADLVWQALTDQQESARWYFGTGVSSTWQPGARYEYRHADGRIAIEGTVERAEPPHLLVMTFAARWNEAVAADPPSRVRYEITPDGERSVVTVVHEDLMPGCATAEQVADGWPYLMSNLKTYLETGAPMP